MNDAGALRSGKGHRNENFPVASWLIDPRHRGRSWRFIISCAPPTTSPITPRCRRKRSLRCSIASMPASPAMTIPMRAAVRLRAALAERKLSPKHAQDLLAAFKLDVTKLRYRDWDDLIGYCSLSAMPVGRFVLDVHGESRDCWPANDALCAALQIINHLQDCKEDYLNLDRVYVPQDALAACGTNVEALAAPRASPQLLNCLHASCRAHRAAAERERCFRRLDRRLAARPRSLRHQHAGASADATC